MLATVCTGNAKSIRLIEDENTDNKLGNGWNSEQLINQHNNNKTNAKYL